MEIYGENMKSKNIMAETASILLEIQAVKLNPAEPFTYASGIRSPIYCDSRMILSFPEKRAKIISFFLEAIKQNNLQFDIVCGIATAGIPHAALIAEKLGKPMIYARSEAKDHGRKNQIEGKLEKGQKVLMVEDLISTGGSSINAVNAVREAGGIVENCVAIFTYEMEKAKKAFSDVDNGCRLFTLSNFSALVETAAESGYITAEQKEIILEWNKNPEEWYGKHFS